MSQAIKPVKGYPLEWDECFEDFFTELHNRPFPVLSTPARLSHIGVLRDKPSSFNDTSAQDKEIRHLQALCQRYGVNPPANDAAAFYQSLGEFDVRWERHSEFCTYTFVLNGKHEQPFSQPPMSLLPEDWLAGLPGKIISAIHIETLTANQHESDSARIDELRPFFEGQRLIGCEIADGNAEVWTAFRLHHDKFNRLLMFNRGLTDSQSGSLLRCLLELETYRNMALMSLPLAQHTSRKISQLEQRLAELLAAINNLSDNDEEADLLQQLSQMAAEIADLIASTRFRFDATHAYYKLVVSRLEELREGEIYGPQTMSEFLDRRLTPAFRTSEAARRRLDDLARRTDRASDYLRTRVDLQIEAQNQELLKSMDHRIELQLYMQETVEGLSIAAISFALVGLFKLMLGALPTFGYEVNEALWSAAFVPVSLIVVWGLFRIIKRRILKRADRSH